MTLTELSLGRSAVRQRQSYPKPHAVYDPGGDLPPHAPGMTTLLAACVLPVPRLVRSGTGARTRPSPIRCRMQRVSFGGFCARESCTEGLPRLPQLGPTRPRNKQVMNVGLLPTGMLYRLICINLSRSAAWEIGVEFSNRGFRVASLFFEIGEWQ